MSKKATLVTVSSGYNSNTTINADLNAINDKLDNTLSLDGSVPNSMGADLDMDSNDILNVNSLTAETIILDGQNLASLTSAASEAEAFAIAAAAAAMSAAASEEAVLAVEDSLPDWQGAWVTATAYESGDLIREDGSTYICLVDHTSGTFSTDLSAMKWELFAQKGAAGAGTGDMLAANNLSDVADAPTALSNLGGQPIDAGLNDISALAVTDGNFIVGDGTNWVVESGATVRASLGLGALATAASITTSEIAAATLVTEAEGISSNDNDTTLPTSAAVKDYVDGVVLNIGAGWEYYNGTDGLLYDDGGTVSEIISPNFEDGYEYQFILDNLRLPSSRIPAIQLFRETSNAYGTALNLENAGGSVGNPLWYADATIYLPRMVKKAHVIDYHSYVMASTITDTSTSAVTASFSAITHTTPQKVLRARLISNAGSILSGQVYMLRRKTGVL